MKRQMFGTLASLMCVAFLGALPKMCLAKEGEWNQETEGRGTPYRCLLR